MAKDAKKFVSDVGVTFFATMTQTALAFSITIILGKWFGPDELGLYRIVLTIFGLTSICAAIGIPSAVIKFVAEYKDNKKKVDEITSTALIVVFVSGIAFTVLFFFLSGTLASAFHMLRLEDLLHVLSFIFPFALINNTLLGLLNGYRRMRLFAFVIIARGGLAVIVTIIFVSAGLGSKGAVLGLVIAECLTSLLLFGISYRYINLAFKNCIPTAIQLIKFGAQIVGANAINSLNKQLDIILIGLFLFPSDVGYYAAAVGLSRFFWLIPASIQRITYPATSEYWSKKNFVPLGKMINKSIKYSSLILVFIAMVVFFYGEFIMTTLFRKDFISSFLPLQILLIGTVIRGGLAHPIGASLTGIGRPDLVLKLTAFMLFTNVVFDILLIPRFGILGAAIATSISLSIGAFINLILIVKIMFIKIQWKWLVKLIGIVLALITLFKYGARFINDLLLGSFLLFAYLTFTIVFLLKREEWIKLKSLSLSFLTNK